MTGVRATATRDAPSPIREALGLKCPVCIDDDHIDAALVHLAALEAVADAAADVWASQGGPDSMRSMGGALARLVAVQDGRPSANPAIPTTAGIEPAPESSCPCKSHGDPDGDCGEKCCPSCGMGESGTWDTHFDRSLCACGSMHTYCNECGKPVDGCELEAGDCGEDCA